MQEKNTFSTPLRYIIELLQCAKVRRGTGNKQKRLRVKQFEMFLLFKFWFCFTNAVTVTSTKRFSLLKDS